MGHFIVSHLGPLRNSFIFSRRHRRQTGPVYRAIRSSPSLASLRSGEQNAPAAHAAEGGLFRLAPKRKQCEGGGLCPTTELRRARRASSACEAKHQTLRRLGGRQPLCGI